MHFKCLICELELATQVEMDAHRLSHTSPPTKIKSLSETLEEYEQNLRQVLNLSAPFTNIDRSVVHPSFSSFSCATCDKHFIAESNRDEHQKTCTQNRQIQALHQQITLMQSRIQALEKQLAAPPKLDVRIERAMRERPDYTEWVDEEDCLTNTTRGVPNVKERIIF